MSKFRIKEIAINNDGTNIWFYPQILISIKRRFQWFWKLLGKPTVIEEYYNFFDKGKYIADMVSKKKCEDLPYSQKEKIIAFRNKEEAELWLIEVISRIRKQNSDSNEKYYKYLGGITDINGTKSHEVKID